MAQAPQTTFAEIECWKVGRVAKGIEERLQVVLGIPFSGSGVSTLRKSEDAEQGKATANLFEKHMTRV